ncbi:MAG: hypothetical protein ACKORI_02605 [Verrucomicrobiota bacterium]
MQFLYAPAFDIPRVEGAVRYRFSVKDSAGRVATFFAEEPWAPLSPVWPDLAAGAARAQ